MRHFTINTVLIIILLFCSGNVIAKTYYVSSRGINTAIGTHFTGGKESFRKCIFNIRDAIKGIHDLYFVLKSSSEQPLINKIKTITLEKGGTSM